MKINVTAEIDLADLECEDGETLEEVILQEVKTKLAKNIMDKLAVTMCQQEIVKVMEEVIRPRAREIMLN